MTPEQEAQQIRNQLGLPITATSEEVAQAIGGAHAELIDIRLVMKLHPDVDHQFLIESIKDDRDTIKELQGQLMKLAGPVTPEFDY